MIHYPKKLDPSQVADVYINQQRQNYNKEIYCRQFLTGNFPEDVIKNLKINYSQFNRLKNVMDLKTKILPLDYKIDSILQANQLSTANFQLWSEFFIQQRFF